jgi:hypothetical protein
VAKPSRSIEGDFLMMRSYVLSSTPSWLAVATIFFVAQGCSRPPDKWEKARLRTAPASGRVVLDGEPVAEATVILWSDAVPTSPSALTAQDGTFHLRTYVPKDGAPVGTYAVSIDKTTENQPPLKDPEAPPPPVEITHHLPKKYRDVKTSGLTAEVTEAGPNEFVFELSTK